MRIILSPDSFKDSLGAPDACAALAEGIVRVWPAAELEAVPMADGGEGTVDALVAATGGEHQHQEVIGPLGEPVEARYGLLGQGSAHADGPTAVIEMAAAAGLPLVPEGQRNPLHTTTFGFGQLIRAALQQDCRHFVLGIGGSATNDGGAGMAQALGVRFYDSNDQLIEEHMTGGLLQRVARIDVSELLSAASAADFVVACDVENPLLGPEGATHTYGPQKGADKDMIARLENDMSHYADVLESATGRTVRAARGAGAAGGLGAALMAYLDARLEPGIDIVLRESRFAERIAGADLIITGEGRIDASTAFGKTIAGVAKAAAAADIPVIALAGSLGDGYEKVHDLGVRAVLSICNGPMSLSQAIDSGHRLLADAAEEAARLISIDLSP